MLGGRTNPVTGRAGRRGAGGFTSVEFMAVAAVLVTMFLLMLAYGTRIYAEQAVQAAAAEAAGVARRFDGTAAAARARGYDFAERLGGPGLGNVTVTVTRGGRTATVTVTGTAPAVVPFLPVEVSATSTGPVERFVGEVADQ